MSYLLYLMFRCDRRCDGCDEKFENFVVTKHTQTRSTQEPGPSTGQKKHDTDDVTAQKTTSLTQGE